MTWSVARQSRISPIVRLVLSGCHVQPQMTLSPAYVLSDKLSLFMRFRKQCQEFEVILKTTINLHK